MGIVLGHHSGGFIDIDLDCPEALKLTQHLPSAGAIFGRNSTPRSHFIYRVDGNAPTKKFVDPIIEEKNKKGENTDKKSMIIEVLGDGGVQTVFPPSTHPSGERIKWATFDEIAVVIYDDLVAAATKIAVAVMLERYGDEGRNHPKVKEWLGETIEHPQALVPGDALAPRQVAPLVSEPRSVDDLKAWIDATLNGIFSDFTALGEGGRNEHLAKVASYRLGRLSAGGYVSKGEAWALCKAAGERNGLWKDDGGPQFRAWTPRRFEEAARRP